MRNRPVMQFFHPKLFEFIVYSLKNIFGTRIIDKTWEDLKERCECTRNLMEYKKKHHVA